MRKINAILAMALVAIISGCGNGFPGGLGRKAQLVGYKTFTVGEAEVRPIKDPAFKSGEVVIKLPPKTPVTVVGVQPADGGDESKRDCELVKLNIKADYNRKSYTGWTYITNVSFDGAVLERILNDAMDHAPYANYIAGSIDGIDGALGMRLIKRMCESAWAERNPEQKEYLYHLASTYMSDIAENDNRAGDATPLHLAAKYDNFEFLRDAYGWCENRNIPIDCPDGANADTPLIVAATNGNATFAEFLMAHGADRQRKNAKGKSAEDYMLASSNAALKNLAVYSHEVADYGQTLASLAAEDMRDPPARVCLDMPASVYIRYVKSGMAIQTADYHDFLNELSIREVSGEVAQTENAPAAFPFDGYIHTDDGSCLNLRDGPGMKGNVRGNVSDGTPVSILARDEHPEEIDDIIDYWYRIRSGNSEGWCFGGYLSKKVPIMDRSLRSRLGFGEQVALAQGDKSCALADCALRSPFGEPVAVRSFEPLEVLDACDPAYISFGDSAAYRYYLVKDANNACGIVSGKYLANGHIASDSDANLDFFLVDTNTDGQTVKTRVFMRDIAKKTCREIVFAGNGNGGSGPDGESLTDAQIDSIKASAYTLRGRKLVFAEFTFERRGGDYLPSRMKVFYNIEGQTAHFALSVEYSEVMNSNDTDAFSNCYTAWDADDPSSVTVIRYGRYNDEGDGSPSEYSNTDTYTRDKNDVFSYKLTKEEHSNELPGI